jgi:hypothetical protein
LCRWWLAPSPHNIPLKTQKTKNQQKKNLQKTKKYLKNKK